MVGFEKMCNLEQKIIFFFTYGYQILLNESLWISFKVVKTDIQFVALKQKKL